MSDRVEYTPKALKEIAGLDKAQVKRIRRFRDDVLLVLVIEVAHRREVYR